jgi:uncharacterized protein DUF1579
MKKVSSAVAILCLLVAVAAVGQAPPTTPKPGPEHKKMEAFVGKWTYEGEAKKTVFGPAGKVSGTDTFEMLPGGLYIQHHYDEKNPLGAMKGTEIWAYDPVRKVYTNSYFNSTGEFGSGTCTVNGNTWTFTGSAVTYEGKTASWRYTMNLTTPTSFTVKSEASTDGKTYVVGFEGKWTKAKS